MTGTNGVLIPPDGYLQGVRELCDRYGILMMADEVMCGFGRTGEWFAVNHWDVVPDMISMAKGLTSSYVPLGGLGLRPHVAAHFDDNVFWGGLTYNSHPVGVAAALATISVYEEDGLIENSRKMGEVLARHHQELKAKHPSRRRRPQHRPVRRARPREEPRDEEPMSPFNVTNETMGRINRFLLDHGVYTMVRWWSVMTNPPLTINEEQLAETFEVIDDALDDRRRGDGGVTAWGSASASSGSASWAGRWRGHLLAAGLPVTVHSRSPGPVDELVAAGAARAGSPAEVAARIRRRDHDAARHARRGRGGAGRRGVPSGAAAARS